MKTNYKTFFTGLVVVLIGASTILIADKTQAQALFGGPALIYQTSLIPKDTTENIGTSTRSWDEGWFNQICLSADCRTSWPAGGTGGSGTVGTSTVPTVGTLAYWTSAAFPSLLGSVATTTVSCSGNASCTSFTAIGSAPVTITATGGSGVGTIATSTALTVGGIVYATSNGYPALVSTAATTTLSASSPLSLSQPISVIGSAASTLTIDTSGTWSGNAGTASALAANGSNCSAGSAAGGVTAGGASEDCTDYWTEAENTAANYEQALTAGDGLTRTADDFDCDTASGSVFGCLSTTDWTTFSGKLGSYDAWTHPIAGVSATTSILRLAGLNASSTVLFDNATSTLLTATTAWVTNLFIGVDTLAEYISDTAGAMFTGNTETDITVTYDDTDNTIDFVVDTLPNLTGILDVDSGGTGWAALQAGGILYGNGTSQVSTTTQGTSGQVLAWLGGIPTWTATTTFSNGLTYSNGNVTADLTASSINNRVATSAVPTVGNLAYWTGAGTPSTVGTVATTTASCSGSASCTSFTVIGSSPVTITASGGGGSISGWATSTPFGSQLLLYPVNGSEDVAFGGTGAAATTTSPFWWDVSATSSYIGNGGTGSSTLQFGPSGSTWLMGYDGADAAFRISSTSKDVGFSTANLLTLLKNGNLGLGTTSPFAKLSVSGEVVASHFTATTSATSTLINLLTTNATTTNQNITGALTFNGVTGTTWASFCATITGSAALCDGDDAAGSGGSDFTFASTFNNVAAATSSKVWLQNQLYASSSIQFNTNLISEHASLRFLDIQGQPNSDYTLVRIKGPQFSGHSSKEATLSLLLDVDGNNTGVNEEFIDFYNERYDDSWQWGMRQAYSGTGVAKPMVFGHWNTAGLKDAGNKLIILPGGAVGIMQATSSVDTATMLHVASSTAPTLMRLDAAPGTNKMIVLGTGNVGIGTTSPYTKLGVAGQVVADNFTATSTTATTSLQKTSITGAVTILGEYMTNFTTYVRALFSAGTGLAYSAGQYSVDLAANFTWTGTHDFSGGTVKQHTYPKLTWPGTATTTTATTTVPIGQAMTAESLSFTTCRVTSGSSAYRFGDGTNWTTYRAASTTAARFTESSNNTFTLSENQILEVGALTAAQITCGLDVIVNN